MTADGVGESLPPAEPHGAAGGHHGDQRQSILGNLEKLRELREACEEAEVPDSTLSPLAARLGQLEATLDIAGLAHTEVLPSALSRAPAAQVAQRARGRALVQEAKKKELLSEGELMTREEYERQRGLLETQEVGERRPEVSWEEMLAWHRKEQEEMASEMESNSMLMRQAAEQIGAVLQEDSAVLQEVQQKTNVNMDKMEHESRRIRQQTKSTCSFTWVSLFLCLLMVVMFMGTVMFMKVAGKGH